MPDYEITGHREGTRYDLALTQAVEKPQRDVSFKPSSFPSLSQAPSVPVSGQKVSPWRLIRWIQAIWELILRAFKCQRRASKEELPPIHHGVYAHLLFECMDSHFAQVSNGTLLKEIHQYLVDEGVTPQPLLKRLEQTVRWLGVIESGQGNLEGVTREIIAEITKLKRNEFCVLPGGFGEHFALYRVTRTGDDAFDFQVISRDVAFKGEEVSVAGKKKMRLGNTFADLRLNEVTDPVWLQALLSIENCPWDLERGFYHLFEKFIDRRIDPADPRNLGLHKELVYNCPVSTVWSFLGGDKDRRKLRRQVHALFRYAQEIGTQPKLPLVAKDFLLVSIKRLRQKMLKMVAKKRLDEAEFKWLSAEFIKVEELVKARPILQVLEAAPDRNPINTRIEFFHAVKPCKVDSASRIVVSSDESDIKLRHAMVPYAPNPKRYVLKPMVQTPITAQNVLAQLHAVLKEAAAAASPLDLQHLLVDFSFSLPFNPYIENFLNWNENPDDPWRQLSEQDRVTASEKLCEIAKRLRDHAVATNTYLPDLVLAIVRIAWMIQYLAELNSRITRIEPTHSFYDFHSAATALGDVTFRHLTRQHQQMLDELYKYEQYRRRVGSYRGGYSTTNYLSDLYLIFEPNDSDRRTTIPPTPQAKHLHTIHKYIRDIHRQKGRGLNLYESRGFLNYWGRGVQDESVGVLIDYPLKQDPRIGIGTEEAIVDNPLRALRNGFIYQQRVSHDLSGKFKEPDLDEESLLAFILSVKPEKAIFNFMGLIEKNPRILNHPGVCTIIELFFLRPSQLTESLKMDSALAVEMPKFFEERIQYCEARSILWPAIFLVHLNQGARHILGAGARFNLETAVRGDKVMQDFESESVAIGIDHSQMVKATPIATDYGSKDCVNLSPPTAVSRFKDYTPKLQRWLAEAFNPESPLAPHRYFLVTEYLCQFESRDSLSHEEMRDLIFYNFFMENTIGDIDNWDPVVRDRIRRMVKKWMPTLRVLQIDPTFFPHILDRICQVFQKPLYDQPWKCDEEFPRFSSGRIRVDLLGGILEDLRERGSASHLPTDISRHDFVRRAFPYLFKEGPIILETGIQGDKVMQNIAVSRIISRYRIQDQNADAFVFRDMQGNDVQIEWHQQTQSPAGSVRCYRKHPADGRWLRGINTPKEIADQLPDCIKAFSFYMRTDRASEIWLFDADRPMFKLSLKANLWPWKTVQLSSVEDLRPGGAARKRMSIRSLNIREFPELLPLRSFERDILLWQNYWKTCFLELYQQGLIFENVQSRWICRSQPYEDYVLDPKKASDALPAGIFLEHPSKPTLFLLPAFSGQFSRFLSPDPQTIRHEAWLSSSNQGFWVFETSLETPLRPRPDQNGKALWCDVICFAMAATQRARFHPFPIAKKALQELERTAGTDFSDEEFIAFARKISDVAKVCTNTPYAEADALGLQSLIILVEKAPPRLKRALEGMMMPLIIAYFSSGKHIDVAVALTEQQLNICLEILKEHDKQFYERNRRLFESGEPQTTVALGKRMRFLPKKDPRLPHLYAHNLQTIMRAQRDLSPQALFLQKHPKVISDSFRVLYSMVVQSPRGSVDFAKMRITLHTAPSDTIINFLALLYDLKEEFPNIQFPPLPNLHYPVLPTLYTPEKERVQGIHSANDEVLASFSKTLDIVLRSCPELKMRAEREFYDQQSGERKIKAAEAASPPTIEELEQKLALARDIPPADLYEPQDRDRLFEANEVDAFFVAAPIPTPDLSFSEMDNKEYEPAVRRKAKQLQEGLESYGQHLQSQRVVQHKIGKPELLRTCIQAKLAEYDRVLSGQFDEIMKLVQVPANDPQLQAGYRRELTREELYRACQQGNMQELLVQANLQTVADYREIERRFQLYLEIESKRKHAQTCLKDLDTMILENAVDSPADGEKLYQMLIRRRAYDTKKFPQMVIVEDLLGFMISEEQAQLVTLYCKNPNAVALAPTGLGKTTVINLVFALLMPNGKNFVTIKVLEPLFKSSLTYLQKHLGGALKKRVTPLQFSMDMPIVHRSQVGDKVVEESAFKEMYRQVLTTALERGVCVTDVRSQPLLRAKLIAIADRLHNLPPNDKPAKIDLEHLYWLSKLLKFFKAQGMTFLDEYDKILKPDEEIHVRISDSKPAPEFIWKTILKIFDLLLLHPRLQLQQNLQAELTAEQRAEILQESAANLAQQWAAAIPGVNREELTHYLQGKSEKALEWVPKLFSSEQQDELAMEKDMLLIVLPLTLAKTSQKKYMRSGNGVDVKPCDYAGVVRESSETEDIRERLAYFVADYFQQGVSHKYFHAWVKKLKKEATEQADTLGLSSLSDTAINRYFQTFFPRESLSGLLDSDILRLHGQVNEDPAMIRKFLELLLPQQKKAVRRITCTAQDQISLSRTAALISATPGCIEGLHRHCRVIPNKNRQDTAMALYRLWGRVKHPARLLTYNPALPGELIPTLLQQNRDIAVVIDGAAALLSTPPEQAADQLRANNPRLEAVGYFRGLRAFRGRQDAPLSRTGQVYRHADTRGAHAILSISLLATATFNRESSLERMMQEVGRLRHEDQPFVPAVPVHSGFSHLKQILHSGARVDALQNGEDTYRSKLHEQNNILSDAMLENLLEPFSRRNFEGGMKQYAEYAPSLVHVDAEDWSKPGNYFALRKLIEQRDADPIRELQSRQQMLVAKGRQLNLRAAAAELAALDYTRFAEAMPSKVFPRSMIGLCAEVEVDTQLAAEVSIDVAIQEETDVVLQKEEEIAEFLPWRFSTTPEYALHSFQANFHPAFDPLIHVTENCVPLKRRTYASSIHHRSLNDSRQSPLHWVKIVLNDLWDVAPRTVVNVIVSDLLDMDSLPLCDIRYDAVRKKYLTGDTGLIRHPDQYSSVMKQLPPLMAQVRFAYGHFNKDQYAEDEWQALKEWLKSLPARGFSLQDMRAYFQNVLLAYRPADKLRFPTSDLALLIERLMKSHG